MQFWELAERVLTVHPLKSAENRDNYASAYRKWLLPSFGQKEVGAISTWDVDEWWAYIGRETSEQNRRNVYSVLRVSFRYAVKWKLVEENPCQVEQPWKNVAQERPVFDVETFRKVTDFLPLSIRDAAYVGFGAHLRISELCGLNNTDWDPATQILTVSRQVRKDGLRPTKERHVKRLRPLHIAISVLEGRQTGPISDVAQPMFRSPKGGRLRVPYFRKQWQRACAAAGVPEMHFHDVRHVGLTLVATAGGTLREVMARGGHSTERAASIYQRRSLKRDVEVAALADALVV